ncbi:MAG: TonB-dependent receptor [Prevotella sp.]|jgi:TonB-linked SusC/RagA family outer membrane protein|nr:TonB-dependent receptor [Prevotella sp.]MCH4181598.1 TonB-dependent receptor [Prevotella sp.]MCH4213126.1 TonB-dependent receptor [Prevotella sp.]MCH4241169.1 TonB-dependent receptor [Prevotella sp.]
MMRALYLSNKLNDMYMKNTNLKTLLRGLFFLFIGSTGLYGIPEASASEVVGVEQSSGIVKGIVVDKNGEPIIGATVKIVGSSNGTVTDLNGRFSVDVPVGSTLSISYIGYKSQMIKADKSSVMVHLVEENKTLNEVVVVGYGTMKRKNFTGSVSTVDIANSPLSLMPNTNVMDALRGTATGINVSQEQGAGQSPSLQIRGQKSVNGGSDPLIVMDGVIYMGTLRDIDPNIIQSMSVLKDATSLAAYGSQAANGVIMITTKKGELGKPMINFNTSWAFSNAASKPNVLSPSDYVKKVNLLNGLSEDADPTWMREFEYENYKEGKTTDWFDYCIRTGLTQNYSTSVSGATKKLNYFLSGTYTDQQGVVKGDDYTRTALNMCLQSDITSWLQIGGQASYTANDYSGPTVYNLYEAVRLSPYGRAERSDGSGIEKFPCNEGIYRVNPLWDVKSGTIDDHDTYTTTALKGHLLLKCPWVNGLSYRMNGTYSIENVERDYFTHEGYYVQEGSDDNRYSAATIANYLASANGYSARTKNTYWVWDNIFNYSHQFGDHFIDATFVYTRDSRRYDYRRFTGSDFSSLGNTNLGVWGLNYAATQKITNLNYTLHNDVGYLWRLNYDYKDTYHLSMSVRRDGSSVFGENQKWGNFPAIGLAWTVTNEKFMQNIKPISYLKVKASWGKNGNQSLSPYQTLSKITLGQAGGYSYPFGNTSEASWGQRITTMGNADLGWESTESVNYGFDLGLLRDRMHIELDGYKSKTTNQIFQRQIPVLINGLTSMYATMGRVDNWGIEIDLTTKNIVTKDFSWQSQLTYYLNRNKLKELYGNGQDDISNSLFLGKSLGAIYGYKVVGIVQAAYDSKGNPIYDSNGKLEICNADKTYAEANGAIPGDVKFANVDGSSDGKITSSDRTILGYSKPNFRMNLGNTIRYKDFELYFLLTGVFGGDGYCRATNLYAYQTNSDVAGDNNLNHGWWTVENKSNKYPRIAYSNGNYRPLQDYGFIRLQDLSLSYTFNQPWMRSMHISNLKVYMACKNLFTLTGWDGGDPEIQQTLGTGYSYGYPLSRTVSFGINLTF